MILYHYNEFSKQYIGEDIADEDPLDEGKFLIPAFATLVKPTEKAGFVPVWNGKSWDQVEDNRGDIYSTETGEASKQSEIGPIPDGFTKLSPASIDDVWNGKKWVLNKEKQNARLAAEARAKRDELLKSTDWTQLPDVSPEVTEKYKQFRAHWRNIPQQKGFPTAIIWTPNEDSAS